MFDESEKVNILGVFFQRIDHESIIQLFQKRIAEKNPLQVCIANVHTVISSQDDPDLMRINNNSLTTMDGAPLVWYANIVHKAGIKERVSGPDLMLDCLDKGREHSWKHYFLGGKPEVLSLLTNKITAKFPGVELVGTESPPFRTLTAKENTEMIQRINDSKADFLWVGLGAPKQEKWIAKNIDRINISVQIGVGAAFDFHSDTIKRAPVWMQKYGLEWLYRLYKDPRLFKRYATSNPRFIFLLLRDIIKIRILHINEIS